jgi:RNA polymerase sigma factor (sigma-70 family)
MAGSYLPQQGGCGRCGTCGPSRRTGCSYILVNSHSMRAETRTVAVRYPGSLVRIANGLAHARLRQKTGWRHIGRISFIRRAHTMSPDAPDDGSLEQVLEAHTRPDGFLVRFIRNQIDHPEDAKDIQQEVLFRYLRFSKESVKNPVGLLRRIAEIVILEHWRRGKYARKFFNRDVTPEDLADSIPDGEPGLDDIEGARRMDERMDEAIDALEPIQRAVIVCKYRDGLTVEETAVRCDISTSRAKHVLQDARESIREFFTTKERGSR